MSIAFCAAVVIGCSAPAHYRLINKSGVGVTLHLIESLNDVPVAAGKSKRFPVGYEGDGSILRLSASRCDYAYRLPDSIGPRLGDIELKLETSFAIIATWTPMIDTPHGIEAGKPYVLMIQPALKTCH